MNKETYIRLYAAHSKENGDEFYHDDGDECFCPLCLGTFFDKNPTAFSAFKKLDLKPDNLADIIGSIQGGDVAYEFDHLIFIKAIIMLAPYLKNEERAHHTMIPFDKLNAFIWKHFSASLISMLPQIPDWYLNGPQKETPSMALDITLGHIIHTEHFKFIHETLSIPPGGDDTYYDYYPGNIDFYNTLTAWFINSENRDN